MTASASEGGSQHPGVASVAPAQGGGGGAPTAPHAVDEATLVGWAKRVVDHDMGLKDADLLDEEFYFIGPFDGPVGKTPFIEGSKGFDLRGAFPDFKFNEHDFRVDKVQPLRVWFTTRKTGTHQGDLPMYGKVIKPTGKTLNFPPECYSCTFNASGKVVKLTGGFVMDAQQGTSGGLGGPLGISQAVGAPRPVFSHLPPVRAISQKVKSAYQNILKRPSPRASTAAQDTATPSPPEPSGAYVPPTSTTLTAAELVSLAETVLRPEGEDLLVSATKNPDRLAQQFRYFEPLVGIGDGLSKDAYLLRLRDMNLRAAFPDLEVDVYNVRVDGSGSAPSTVWATVRFRGTHTGTSIAGGRPVIPAATGLRWVSAPEAVSLTFDDQQHVTRMTGGAVLDREEGNTGGLGGLFGLRYAMGRPSLPLLTRPLRFHTKSEWAQALTATFKGMFPTPAHTAQQSSSSDDGGDTSGASTVPVEDSSRSTISNHSQQQDVSVKADETVAPSPISTSTADVPTEAN